MKPSKMATTTTLKMKLLVDAKSQHVLFAEAGKDVVDFLFSLLSLPLATVVKLLSKKSMVGSVGNLYGSIENLDSTYLQYGAAKDALLRPAAFSPAACSGGSLRLTEPSSAPSKKFYKCSSRQNNNCLNYMTDGYNEGCPSCPGKMVTALEYVAPKQMVDAASEAAKGFVQDVVTYTVMDDLTVKPMSTISSSALLSAFDVKDFGSLQEKNVQLGYNEGIEILKASLQSKTVLTDVFLGKKLI